MMARSRIAAALAETLWVTRPGRSREAFERWQARRLQHWMTHDLPGVDFYRHAPDRLEALPIIDKGVVMADFAAFNRGRISACQGWQALTMGGRIGEVSIGASTGTSGNRALYAITAAERYRWLGTILAKSLPTFLWRPERVAVLLPQGSALYDTARLAGTLRLTFHDLTQGVESWLASLETFDPTTLVAPPRVLRYLAQQGARLHPRRLYAAAETLDPVDRQLIEAHFDRRLGEIYMATEGLLAVSCSHGGLHLAEDANVFEFEPLSNGLVSPLVTGFRRRFQIMARYRMNDLLRLSSQTCACGSPLRVVTEVVGRQDDVFVFETTDGSGPLLVTPDVLRNAVLTAACDITDFRLIRETPWSIVLILDPALADTSVAAVLGALQTLFARRGLSPHIQLRREAMPFDPQRKLRRVESRLPPQWGR